MLRAVHLLVDGGAVADAQEHRVAHNLLGLPAGIPVVAHVRHAGGGQQLAARGQDCLLHLVWDPAIHPMTDDEVELAHCREVEWRDIAVHQLNVVKPQGADPAIALVYVNRDRSMPTVHASGWVAAMG
jgi:hypothetical protein